MADTYLGGERDELEKVTPKWYDKFFREEHMYFVLGTLVVFLLLIRLVV